MMENDIECPLLNRIIDDGYCYDINMIANDMIKENILEDKIDKEKAKEICNKCTYKPL